MKLSSPAIGSAMAEPVLSALMAPATTIGPEAGAVRPIQPPSFPRSLIAALAAAAAFLALAAPAVAWNAIGHMTTSAIAYDVLQRDDPGVVRAVLSLVSALPQQSRMDAAVRSLSGPEPPAEFAATDAKLQACVARDSSNAHIMACTSVAQIAADARLNGVYQAWTEVLKHPKPDEVKRRRNPEAPRRRRARLDQL